MNVHSARRLTDAIIVALQNVGLEVGRAVKPAGVADTTGYVVVYGLVGGSTDGPIGHPDDDASAMYQLTAVGHDAAQCEWVADKARNAILSASFDLGSRVVARVAVNMLGGVTRDDDVQPPVFYSPDRYRIFTTPRMVA